MNSIFRIKKTTKDPNRKTVVFLADVIANTSQEAMDWSKDGMVTNWRINKTYEEKVDQKVEQYEFVLQVNEETAVRPKRPLLLNN